MLCMDERSCVKKGYIKDDYVHLFVRRPVRRSPIINRGMFYLLPETHGSMTWCLFSFCFLYLCSTS